MISSLTFSHSSTYIDYTRAKNEGGGVGWVDLGGGGGEGGEFRAVVKAKCHIIANRQPS